MTLGKSLSSLNQFLTLSNGVNSGIGSKGMLEDYYEIIHMKCLELCVTHFAINIYQVSAATINYAQDLASLHANPDSANQNLVK